MELEREEQQSVQQVCYEWHFSWSWEIPYLLSGGHVDNLGTKCFLNKMDRTMPAGFYVFGILAKAVSTDMHMFHKNKD